MNEIRRLSYFRDLLVRASGRMYSSSQKIKITSHVFRVLPPGFSRDSSKSQSLCRGEARHFYKSQRLSRGSEPLQGEKLRIFPSLRAYNMRREGSGFCQVPEPILWSATTKGTKWTKIENGVICS